MIWFKRLALGSLGITLVGLLFVYGLSSLKMSQTYSPQARGFSVSETSDIQEGKRLAQTRGCYYGCHGPGVGGQEFYGLYAPNLSKVAHAYTDDQMEQVIRQGIRPDGTSVFMMSSDMFQYLSDEDLGHIIAFLRSQPLPSGKRASRSASLTLRFNMITGDIQPMVNRLAEETPPVNADRSTPEIFGRYLVYSTCVECHGVDLRGQGNTPNLIVASAYEKPEFYKLMNEGVPIGGRDLGLMRLVAVKRTSLFAEEELNAIYAYLHSDGFIEAAFDE